MRTFLIFTILAILLAIVAARLRPAIPDLYPTYMGVSSPPLSVEESLASFRLADDTLQITCAAMQPMVEAPVAAQFDERGRLWVVEMRTYMPDIEGTGELEKRNRISILEDTDADGVFDTSTIFMDDLALPRGVAPCFDGALVIEPPNLLFCRDTDGDGKADERTILATGFAGLESPEHAGNGLLFGLDGWYHCSQHKEEFRIGLKRSASGKEELHIETRRTPSHGQWGITQDALGRLYYTPNSNPLLVDLYPKYWAAMNPNMSGAAGMGVDIAKGECWPIHPTPGANRGYQEGVLRDDKTLASVTAACGPVILTDTFLGETFKDNAFLCDAVGNLVKRLVLKETPSGPRATNAYHNKEFLASTDERFRPVNTVEGPDGSLYILDMYRGVIQHKTFETNYLKDQYRKRNLETPLNMGRIWRISPVTPPKSPRAPFPDLRKQTPAQLTANLSSSNSWVRMQSLRLMNVVDYSLPAAEHLEVVQLAPTVKDSLIDWNVLDSIARDVNSPGNFAALLLLQARNKQSSPASDLAAETPSGRLASAQIALTRTKSLSAVRLFASWSVSPPEPILIPYIAAGLARFEQYDTLVSFLAQAGNTAPARSAALCFLHGQESHVLALALSRSPSEPLESFISELLTCTLNSKNDQRLAGLNLIANAPIPLRAKLLNRLDSYLRIGSSSPRALELSQQPTAFLNLAVVDANHAQRIQAISERLSWPGKPIPVPSVRPLTDEEQSRFERGNMLYHACTTCHQPDGRGAPGQAPALAGSAYVNGPPEKLAKILLHGLQGPYEVGGQGYEGAMPVPPGVGSDYDIAAVLTYVRRSFGNTADPVDQQTVSKVRKQNAKRYKSWTRQELDRSR